MVTTSLVHLAGPVQPQDAGPILLLRLLMHFAQNNICTKIGTSWKLEGDYLSICLSILASIYLSIYLFLHLSIYIYLYLYLSISCLRNQNSKSKSERTRLTPIYDNKALADADGNRFLI